MKKYVLGKPYNVQRDTEHQHHITWSRFQYYIHKLGHLPEERARHACQKDGNPGYLNYVVRNGWLREVA